MTINEIVIRPNPDDDTELDFFLEEEIIACIWIDRACLVESYLGSYYPNHHSTVEKLGPFHNKAEAMVAVFDKIMEQFDGIKIERKPYKRC